MKSTSIMSRRPSGESRDTFSYIHILIYVMADDPRYGETAKKISSRIEEGEENVHPH